MKSSSLLTLRPSSALHPRPRTYIPTSPTPLQTQRHFSNPLIPTQSLTASRILPYHASDLYALIADIPSYPSFLPYCTSSTITSHSAPDALYETRWPRAADLRVGWAGYSEVFRSRVYCQPYRVLEAVAGEARSTIRREELPHYYDEGGEEVVGSAGEENPLFTSLLTRWTLREFPFKPPPGEGTGRKVHESGREEESAPRTEVDLVIEVRFASAVYAALSQAVAPKVAGMMVGAFEERAREVLGEGKAVGREGIEREKGAVRERGERSALDGVMVGAGLKEGP